MAIHSHGDVSYCFSCMVHMSLVCIQGDVSKSEVSSPVPFSTSASFNVCCFHVMLLFNVLVYNNSKTAQSESIALI
jgi:hypothetical protein